MRELALRHARARCNEGPANRNQKLTQVEGAVDAAGPMDTSAHDAFAIRYRVI
jgi:hypothetical protein